MTSRTLPQNLRDHYLSFGTFTYPGLYQQALVGLPDDIREIGLLVRKNIIHRTTLGGGNIDTNAHFDKLKELYETKKEYRLLSGALL